MDAKTWAAKADALRREGGGALTMSVIMHGDRAKFARLAASGHARAARLLPTVNQMLAAVESGTRQTAITCATCTTPLLDVLWAAVIVAPDSLDHEHTLSLAICSGCGATVSEVQRRAFFVLQKVYTGLRPVVISEPGGRA